jgi:hypothetical protein
MLERWIWFIGYPPWLFKNVIMSYDESMWLRRILQCATRFKITMKLKIAVFPFSRKNNQYRMVKIRSSLLIFKSYQRGRHCRCTWDYIRPEAYYCKRFKAFYKERDAYCIQEEPSIPTKSTQRKFIGSLTLTHRHKLKQPLKDWTVPIDEIRVPVRKYRKQDLIYKEVRLFLLNIKLQ